MLPTKTGTATEARTNGFAGTMQRFTLACALSLASLILGSTEANAQAMADYTAYPPFVGANAVPPNILLLLDNSGSMNGMAFGAAFDQNQTYSGLFDSLECYDYGSNKFLPDATANPATLGSCTTSPY